MGCGASSVEGSEYNLKASMYDEFRAANPGWDTVLRILKPLKAVEGKKVLDVGCGTCSILHAILELRPASYHGFDPSFAMIEKALERKAELGAPGHKLSDIPVHLTCQASTKKLEAGSYQFAFCLQVLQNVAGDNPARDGASRRIALLTEIHRLLAPGGMVLVTTRSRKQQQQPHISLKTDAALPSVGSTYGDLYWYADSTVTPEAVEYMEKAVPANPVGELEAAGFESCRMQISPDLMICETAYRNPDLLSNPAFRAADSFFSRLTQDELKKLLEHTNKLKQAGKLAAYIEDREKLRCNLGHVAVLVGRKPL